MSRTGGKLTTHVLDTASGRPAAGLAVTLAQLTSDGVRELGRFVTNADGRMGAPLLEGEAFRPGTFELAFHVGDYFRARGAAASEPPFLEVVPVRFGVADADAHYHVPLLVAPYGYTTYRGS